MRQFCGCGYGTRKHSRFRKHQSVCVHGQTEQAHTEETKVEAQQDEGIQVEEMTRAELIELLEREGHTGVRRLNRPELVNLVGGG